jgi:dUTP pyrophosphatase
MRPDEYLGIHVRSGFSVKNMVSCINGEGIIDADYYNNPDNEGHIFVALVNHSEIPIQINKGMRIAQGIFYSYLKTDNDRTEMGKTRTGGLGSTGEM